MSSAAWLGCAPLAVGAEFLAHELIVVKLLIRQAKPVGRGAIRPAGGFIRAAFRTGAGARRKNRTAVWAKVTFHRKEQGKVPACGYPVPAYSSSVTRFSPIST